jgi:hypothetical protein
MPRGYIPDLDPLTIFNRCDRAFCKQQIDAVLMAHQRCWMLVRYVPIRDSFDQRIFLGAEWTLFQR